MLLKLLETLQTICMCRHLLDCLEMEYVPPKHVVISGYPEGVQGSGNRIQTSCVLPEVSGSHQIPQGH